MRPGYIAAAAVIGLVAAAAVVYARTPDPDPDRVGSAVRLGPADGEKVPAYVSRVAADLASRPAGQEAYALVALISYVRPGAVPGLVGGLPVSRELARVPLPRVQTEVLTLRAADPVQAGSELTARGRELLARAGESADPVSAAVLAAQARALTADCACLLAVVVRGSAGQLASLAGRPGVRAVEAAPAEEAVDRLAYAPLLPEQADVVGPPPDDGAAALASATPYPGA